MCLGKVSLVGTATNHAPFEQCRMLSGGMRPPSEWATIRTEPPKCRKMPLPPPSEVLQYRTQMSLQALLYLLDDLSPSGTGFLESGPEGCPIAYCRSKLSVLSVTPSIFQVSRTTCSRPPCAAGLRRGSSPAASHYSASRPVLARRTVCHPATDRRPCCYPSPQATGWPTARSEERRVGQEGRSRWSPDH